MVGERGSAPNCVGGTFNGAERLETQLFTVTFTVYAPVAAVVAFGIVGFCNKELNPFGPVHVYVDAPATVVANKFNVPPAQIGLLLEGFGDVGGLGSLNICVAALALVQVLKVQLILL